MIWLFLFCSVAFNALAGLFMKLGAQPPFHLPTLRDPMAAVTNWPLLLALGSYGSAFLAYAASLARLPLSVAGPVVTCGTTLMIALFAFAFFEEPMRVTKCIGIATVIVGVVLITRS